MNQLIAKTARPRVLFVSHDAYRGGATIFLLNMLSWFKASLELPFECLLQFDGEMRPEFEALGTTHVLQRGHPAKAMLRKLRPDSTAVRESTLQALVDRGGFNLVYLNTITLGELIRGVNFRGIPVITHVHELDSSVRRFGRGQEQVVIEQSDRLIAVSDAVAAFLSERLACPAGKLQRIYGFVKSQARPSLDRAALRAQKLTPLRIQPDAFIVGCCGFGDLRKGIDLLVPLAAQTAAEVLGRPIHFIWVGAVGPEYPLPLAQEDARLAQVAERVHFVGSTTEPLDWLACFDLHLLLAREDPFPLVVMEAAALSVPTVCFEGAGGAQEFVRSGAGLSSRYLDLQRLSSCLIQALEDQSQREGMGRRALQKVTTEHDADVILPQVFDAMTAVIETRGNGQAQVGTN